MYQRKLWFISAYQGIVDTNNCSCGRMYFELIFVFGKCHEDELSRKSYFVPLSGSKPINPLETRRSAFRNAKVEPKLFLCKITTPITSKPDKQQWDIPWHTSRTTVAQFHCHGEISCRQPQQQPQQGLFPSQVLHSQDAIHQVCCRWAGA